MGTDGGLKKTSPPYTAPRFAFCILNSALRRGQPERNQLAWEILIADRNDDVLAPIEHVRHRRSGLWRGHVDGACILSGLLVVRTQHRAPTTVREGHHAAFTGDH